MGGVDLDGLIQTLWADGFFSVEKTIQNVLVELQSRGYNIEFDPIYSVLKNSSFVLTKFKELEDTGFLMPSYIQKYPPPVALGMSEVIYSKGYAYDFYKDIKEILRPAAKEVSLCDSYVGEELVTLYFDSLRDKVEIRIRILTSDQETHEKEKFFEIAKKFALLPNKMLEVRVSSDCHDRMIFVDEEAWVCGSAFKDAGKKPTYLIKVKNAKGLKSIFDHMWAQAIKKL